MPGVGGLLVVLGRGAVSWVGVRKVRAQVPLSAGCRQGIARDEAREPQGTCCDRAITRGFGMRLYYWSWS